MLESLAETLTVFLSAGGIISVFVCTLLKRALNKAKADAEKRKRERNEQELLRLEGEARMAKLVLVLARYTLGKADEDELEKAEAEYLLYTEKADTMRRKILCDSIID